MRDPTPLHSFFCQTLVLKPRNGFYPQRTLGSSAARSQSANRIEHTNTSPVSPPPSERILEAYHELGTQTSVATFFGVSRRTVTRWTQRLNLKPEMRPEIPINQVLSDLLSTPAARARVAQWISDEASITVAHSRQSGRTSLMVEGAMNDDGAIDVIAEQLGARVISGATPPKGRLPTHIVKLQGVRAYCLLSLLSDDLKGLKALESRAALSFFPSSGVIRGKLTTDVYMGTVWRQFARQSVEAWNERRRTKLSQTQLDDMVEAWIQNRTARARRGLDKRELANAGTVSTSAPPSPSPPSPRT